MAHYAFLDENNIVTEVITGRNEYEVIDGISDWEEYYGNIRNQTCKRTSYNGNIRKNFAAVGGSYDPSLDAFIPIKPYQSWILDEEKCQWIAPKANPSGNGVYYKWSEDDIDWVVDHVISKKG